jgi:mRNA-degrading endonuclease RelE of RelBE toxin-antitoxin system
MYSIDLTNKSKKFLSKLSQKEKTIILKKLYSIKENPFRFVKKLQGNKLWRLRVGDYRAVLDIIISGKKIIVINIGQRKKIYN